MLSEVFAHYPFKYWFRGAVANKMKWIKMLSKKAYNSGPNDLLRMAVAIADKTNNADDGFINGLLRDVLKAKIEGMINNVAKSAEKLSQLPLDFVRRFLDLILDGKGKKDTNHETFTEPIQRNIV